MCIIEIFCERSQCQVQAKGRPQGPAASAKPGPLQPQQSYSQNLPPDKGGCGRLREKCTCAVNCMLPLTIVAMLFFFFGLSPLLSDDFST